MWKEIWIVSYNQKTLIRVVFGYFQAASSHHDPWGICSINCCSTGQSRGTVTRRRGGFRLQRRSCGKRQWRRFFLLYRTRFCAVIATINYGRSDVTFKKKKIYIKESKLISPSRGVRLSRTIKCPPAAVFTSESPRRPRLSVSLVPRC